MRRHGRGAIVNFSSTYGNGVNPENPINWVPVTYCAAKGAIRGLTTSLARDLAPEIRVNALAPGPISGNWEEEWGVAPEHIQEAKAMNPLGRFGDPREIAETVFSSPQMAPVTSTVRSFTSRGVGFPRDDVGPPPSTTVAARPRSSCAPSSHGCSGEAQRLKDQLVPY
jgi:NAD(P)-dependent dehydrogenase (short-subunit alcohol dehydrogenase family)